MLKIVATSDIEDNKAAVELLLNDINPLDYDCAVITGDIGCYKAWTLDQFSSVLPTFYVYGNHDIDEYSTRFSPNAHHVHHRVEEFNGYYISGYSGCPANWGQNPIALALLNQLDEKHNNISNKLDALKAAQREEYREFSKIHNMVEDNVLCEKHSARTVKGRELRAIKAEYTKIIDSHRIAMEAITSSKEYNAYRADRKVTFTEILHQNKQQLFKLLVLEHGLDMRKTVFLTHEKFTFLNDYFPIPPLVNIYGHSRPHHHKRWRKSNFINVSALDNNPTFYNMITNTPKEDAPGLYASVTINGEEVSTKFINLSRRLPTASELLEIEVLKQYEQRRRAK